MICPSQSSSICDLLLLPAVCAYRAMDRTTPEKSASPAAGASPKSMGLNPNPKQLSPHKSPLLGPLGTPLPTALSSMCSPGKQRSQQNSGNCSEQQSPRMQSKRKTPSDSSRSPLQCSTTSPGRQSRQGLRSPPLNFLVERSPPSGHVAMLEPLRRCVDSEQIIQPTVSSVAL